MSFALNVLSGLGLFIAIAGWIWLVLQITRSRPVLGLVAVIVPFFTWYYALRNWDVAKRPFLIQIAGLGAWIVFGFAANVAWHAEIDAAARSGSSA